MLVKVTSGKRVSWVWVRQHDNGTVTPFAKPIESLSEAEHKELVEWMGAMFKACYNIAELEHAAIHYKPVLEKHVTDSERDGLRTIYKTRQSAFKEVKRK